MVYTSKRLNDTDPVVIFTYDGELTREIFREVLEDNVRYIKEIGEPIYIIADARRLETTFVDMLKIMQEAQQEGEGRAQDDSIRMLIFVGSSSFARMYRDTMTRRGTAFGITIFEDMDDAIETVRVDIERRKRRTDTNPQVSN